MPAPEGYHTVTPSLSVNDAPAIIQFLKDVFGATERHRLKSDDGKVMHAEVRIGDSTIMLGDACEGMGPSAASLYVYVDDADATYQRALEAGGTSAMEPADMFWGDRMASVKDASGNSWIIATHVEDVSPEEIDRRARQFAQQAATQG
ncbi:MAG: VOC family protein [Phycisphaeraceae bacterium]